MTEVEAAAAFQRDQLRTPFTINVRITGGIDIGLYDRISQQLEMAHRVDYMHVHLDIRSKGGSCDQAFAVVHLLRSLCWPISATAQGECLSAAAIIYAAADLRYAVPSARFLFHRVRLQRADMPEFATADKLEELRNSLETTDGEIVRHFQFRTGMDADWLRYEMATEDSITALEAQAFGLVHAIDEQLDPDWPTHIKRLPAHVYPPRMRSAGFLKACRTLGEIQALSAR